MFPNTKSKDEVALQSAIYRTKEYDKFKVLTGNRPTRTDRVNSLVRRMEKYGNLMQFTPVQVTEKFEIIDGQHRVAAAAKLGYEVFYEIKEGGNIDIVRQLNSGTNNWDWKDFAESYALKGNHNYVQFLKIYEEMKLPFSVVFSYFTGGAEKMHTTKGSPFIEGDFKVVNLDIVKRRLQQFRDIADTIGTTSKTFAIACYRFMGTSRYDHTEMLRKLVEFGDPLRHCITIDEFYFALEQVERTK